MSELVNSQPLNQTDRILRDRIAAVLYRLDGFIGPLAEAAELILADYRKTADAVIAELGLRQQGLRNGFYLVNEPPWDRHRYVTDWKADDE